jgi:hypothetical protein
MASKVGSGGRLICCDCRLPLGLQGGAGPGQPRRSTLPSQLSTALLVTVFAMTAAALMTLKDQGNPTLGESQQLRLEGRDPDGSPLRRLARLRLQASGQAD